MRGIHFRFSDPPCSRGEVPHSLVFVQTGNPGCVCVSGGRGCYLLAQSLRPLPKWGR